MKPKRRMFTYLVLCLWFLFGNRPSNIPQTTADGTTELISFNAPLAARPTFLERLKDEDIVERYCQSSRRINAKLECRI